MNTTFEKNFSEFEISIETELCKIIRDSNKEVEENKIYVLIEEIVESIEFDNVEENEYKEILEQMISFDDDKTSEKFYELISIKVKMFNFWIKFMK